MRRLPDHSCAVSVGWIRTVIMPGKDVQLCFQVPGSERYPAAISEIRPGMHMTDQLNSRVLGFHSIANGLYKGFVLGLCKLAISFIGGLVPHFPVLHRTVGAQCFLYVVPFYDAFYKVSIGREILCSNALRIAHY